MIWRSGSSLVLYRGISYKLKCVQSFIQQNNLDTSPGIRRGVVEAGGYVPEDANYPKNVPKEQLSELCELNDLLDELGPRFHDWAGCAPLPVDADLLPTMVLGYRCPFRILPQRVKPCLSNKEMTEMRRLARTSPPHFALGLYALNHSFSKKKYMFLLSICCFFIYQWFREEQRVTRPG